jgi:hypothetical protein
MTVKVVPLPAQQGLKFDVILEGGYVKTFNMDDYELRQYRGLSIADVIEQKVIDLLAQLGYNNTSAHFSIIFC